MEMENAYKVWCLYELLGKRKSYLEGDAEFILCLKSYLNNHLFILQDCVIYKDYTALFFAAKALMTIQALYGIIPNIYGKGENAKVILLLS